MSAVEHKLVPLNQLKLSNSVFTNTDIQSSIKLTLYVYHHNTWVHYAFVRIAPVCNELFPLNC